MTKPGATPDPLMAEGRAIVIYRDIGHPPAPRPSPRATVTEHHISAPASPSSSPSPSPSFSRPPQEAYGPIEEYALRLVGAEQFACLLPLWERESGWNPSAQNPSSGAYGIPQALPGGKMASAGADWQTDPYTQIKWGVGYIESVYGSPCAAWDHEREYSWY